MPVHRIVLSSHCWKYWLKLLNALALLLSSWKAGVLGVVCMNYGTITAPAVRISGDNQEWQWKTSSTKASHSEAALLAPTFGSRRGGEAQNAGVRQRVGVGSAPNGAVLKNGAHLPGEWVICLMVSENTEGEKKRVLSSRVEGRDKGNALDHRGYT